LLLKVDDLADMELAVAMLAHYAADPTAGMPGNVPAGSRRPAGEAPGSEVSLDEIVDHRLVEFYLRQRPFEPGVLLLKLAETLASSALLPP